MTDRIADIWGSRTPYAVGGGWPTRTPSTPRSAIARKSGTIRASSNTLSADCATCSAWQNDPRHGGATNGGARSPPFAFGKAWRKLSTNPLVSSSNLWRDVRGIT